MNPTWASERPPPQEKLTLGGIIRIALRGIPLVGILCTGLLFLLLLRLIERPIFQNQRPFTPHITVLVCRLALGIIGLRVATTGKPMQGPGGFVANHSSWLDIFVLNSAGPLYFVSKSEVASWPGIGWLARATGTVFVRRRRSEAAQQQTLFENRLSNGHKLLFFPEGTSSDGQQVLDFKPTLFAAFFSPTLRENLQIQPVSVTYRAPVDQDVRFYGWWGDMEFTRHLLQVLASRSRGRVDIVWHEPLVVSSFEDRKALSKAAEHQVRAGFSTAV